MFIHVLLITWLSHWLFELNKNPPCNKVKGFDWVWMHKWIIELFYLSYFYFKDRIHRIINFTSKLPTQVYLWKHYLNFGLYLDLFTIILIITISGYFEIKLLISINPIIQVIICLSSYVPEDCVGHWITTFINW